MGFSCGIVGLPNVGKSTLFNALTKTAAAQAENYPFCTIDPNRGDVAVPDKRLVKLAEIAESKRIIPTQLTFVDIAGLVRGASKGEGLGNQFLANIREVDAIIHILRCFEDDNVTHVEGKIDPLSDMETVETELMLADIENLERQLSKVAKRAKIKEPEALGLLPLIENALTTLNAGKPARVMSHDKEQIKQFKQLNLLTAKPVLYVCNVDEIAINSGNALMDGVFRELNATGEKGVAISAAIEMEIANLESEDQENYLKLLGLKQSGLDKIISVGYELLGLITYFTAGPKETRAWTLAKGALAPQAAGVIHSDFEKGFIRAQTITYGDYIRYNGEQGAKAAGKAYDEGRNYPVKDGDVMLFKFAI